CLRDGDYQLGRFPHAQRLPADLWRRPLGRVHSQDPPLTPKSCQEPFPRSLALQRFLTPLSLPLAVALRLPRAWDRFYGAGIGGFPPHLGQFRLVELTAYVRQTTTDGRVCRSRNGLLVQIAQLSKELLGGLQESELFVRLGRTLLLRVEQCQLIPREAIVRVQVQRLFQERHGLGVFSR